MLLLDQKSGRLTRNNVFYYKKVTEKLEKLEYFWSKSNPVRVKTNECSQIYIYKSKDRPTHGPTVEYDQRGPTR